MDDTRVQMEWHNDAAQLRRGLLLGFLSPDEYVAAVARHAPLPQLFRLYSGTPITGSPVWPSAPCLPVAAESRRAPNKTACQHAAMTW